MTDRVCECCGQTLPRPLDVSADVPLSEMEWDILERVHEAGPNGIRIRHLFDFVYGADPNGGPGSGIKVLYVHVAHINKKLQKTRYAIRGHSTTRVAGRYRLVEEPALSEIVAKIKQAAA